MSAGLRLERREAHYEDSADAATPIVNGVDISRLRFRYAIEGDNPPWRPVSAFDDGSKVYIEMPSGIAQGEAPPLFVMGTHGDAQLVNYRLVGGYYIVDVADLDAALSWAARCPGASSGTMEVRPIY